MKRFYRRKKAGITAAVLLAVYVLLCAVPVSADVQKGTEPDYRTDYYMIVESKAGGVDIYSDPDLDSTKLNDSLIPNGTALRIEGEVEDEKDKRLWGYTQYHGMYGYVPEDDLKPAQSRQEAIDSELYIAGSDHVNYNTDYDVTVDSDEDGIHLYQGPGEKYGPVPGTDEIKNGETLHIVQDAEMVDGSVWGMTDSLEKDGWVNMEDVTEEKTEQENETAKDTELETVTDVTETPVGNEKEAEPAKDAGITKAADITGSAGTPKAEETPKAQKTSEAEDEAETPEVTEPAEAETPEATAPDEAETPEAAEPAVTDTPEAEEAADAVSRGAETERGSGYQPAAVIVLAAVAAVIILFVYHFKKR